MLYRLGDFVFRRARLVLVVAGVLLAAAAAVGVGAFGKLEGGGFDDPAAQSTRAADRIDQQFGGRDNLVFLVKAKDGTVDSPAVAQAGEELTATLNARAPAVDRVTSYWTTHAPPLRSTDGSQALVLVHVAGDNKEVTDRAKALIDDRAKDSSAVSITAGGAAAVNVQVNQQVARSLAIAEAIAVPIILVLLLFAFGSVVSALLPLALGLIAILATFFELFVVGSITNVSVYSISLTTQLGLGLGIDYALLLVSRYREQLRAGDDVREAVARTTATAGRTIAFSAVTLAAAMTALLIFPQYFLRSFAFAGMGVALLAAVAALLIIPALLAVLGHRVNAGKVRWAASGRGDASPMWERIARAVTRRPVLAAVPVVAVLLAAASPLLGVGFGTPDQTVLRPGMSTRQVSDALATGFNGSAADTVDIVTTGPVGPTAGAEYARTISALPGVARVDSSVGSFAHGTDTAAGPGNAALGNAGAQRYTVLLSADAASAGAQQVVQDIRALPAPSGDVQAGDVRAGDVQTLVGGRTAALIDSKHSIGSRLPWAVAIVGVLTFVLLFLFTGSVLQPLRALAVNGLGLAASLGVMAWIFQDGHLASVLDFTARPMDTSMSVLLLIVAFGLSMDYEVFLTSRIKELHDHGADTRTAVVQGLARTGRIVSTAAALLAVALISFGTSTVSFLQMFGLGAGLAVLLDATLIRGALVPAVTGLLGERIWYAPGFLRRLHARVGLSESEQPAAVDAPAKRKPVLHG